MRQTLRISALCALIALTAVSTFAQSGPMVGTVIDVDEGRGRLQIEYDDDRTRMTIETDAVATVYYGFGGVIAGKPEIFTGSSGLSNVRLGDRIEVRARSAARAFESRPHHAPRTQRARTGGCRTTRQPTRRDAGR
jgi:hypothetical protein